MNIMNTMNIINIIILLSGNYLVAKYRTDEVFNLFLIKIKVLMIKLEMKTLVFTAYINTL